MSKKQYYHVDKFIKKYCGNPIKTLGPGITCDHSIFKWRVSSFSNKISFLSHKVLDAREIHKSFEIKFVRGKTIDIF